MNEIKKYVYSKIDLSESDSKKLNSYDTLLLEYLNKDLLNKREDILTVLMDYYYLFDDSNERFKEILILTLEIMANIINANIYIIYDDNVKIDHYAFRYCKADFELEDHMELLVNTNFAVLPVLMKLLMEKNSLIKRIKNTIKKEEKNKVIHLKLN